MQLASEVTGTTIREVEQLRALESYTLIILNQKVIASAPRNMRMFGPVSGGDFAPRHPALSLKSGQFDRAVKVSYNLGGGNRHVNIWFANGHL